MSADRAAPSGEGRFENRSWPYTALCVLTVFAPLDLLFLAAVWFGGSPAVHGRFPEFVALLVGPWTLGGLLVVAVFERRAPAAIRITPEAVIGEFRRPLRAERTLPFERVRAVSVSPPLGGLVDGGGLLRLSYANALRVRRAHAAWRARREAAFGRFP
jgi:hypothetical protein